MSSSLFVTAAINIQRDGRSFNDHYIKSLEKLKSTIPNLVVYDTINRYPYLEDVKRITQNPGWYNQEKWLRQSVLVNEKYIPLTFSKLHFLVQSFGSEEYYYWIDAGIYSSFGGAPDMNKLPRDEFFMASFPYHDNTEVHGLSKRVMYELGWTGGYVCRATLFGGTKRGILKVCEEFHNVIQECIARNAIGTEESMFTLVHSRRPDLVTLYEMPNGDIKNLTTDFYYTHIEEEERPFATRLAEWISSRIAPKNLLDIGCGPGMYVDELLKRGVPSLGIEISNKICKPYVLNKSAFDMHETADAVLCLEVAEHLPEEQANAFALKVVESTERVLIWTAAIPGQGGVGHINCQPKEYWRERIQKCGLVYDDALTQECRNFAFQGYHMGWFTNNLQIFRKPTITLTITTCKRYTSFVRTLRALQKYCTDFDTFQQVLVVDDSSTDEDRKRMKEEFPCITLVCHERKSHAHSLNIIRDHVHTDFIFMFEDDWECHEPFEVQALIREMLAKTIDNLRTNTILMNGRLDEDIALNVFSSSKLIQKNQEWIRAKGYTFDDEEHGGCWPGFSLNPIILRREVLDEPFDETAPSGFTEFDWAARHAHKRWYGKSIGGIRHIENNPCAYVLNENHRWWD